MLSKYASILWKYKSSLSTNILSKYTSILSKYKGILSNHKSILSSTKVYFQVQKYTFKVQKYTFKVQKYTLEVQKYTVEKKNKSKIVESAIWFNWFTYLHCLGSMLVSFFLQRRTITKKNTIPQCYVSWNHNDHLLMHNCFPKKNPENWLI